MRNTTMRSSGYSMRKCPRCQRRKRSDTGFYASQPYRCKVCVNVTTKERHSATDKRSQEWHWRLAKYGITKEQYEEMAEQQGFRCAICEKTPNYRLVVDHDHATGEIRGLLCKPCNLDLGWYERTHLRTDAFASYLSGGAT